jgi:hypothetical protein
VIPLDTQWTKPIPRWTGATYTKSRGGMNQIQKIILKAVNKKLQPKKRNPGAANNPWLLFLKRYAGHNAARLQRDHGKGWYKFAMNEAAVHWARAKRDNHPDTWSVAEDRLGKRNEFKKNYGQTRYDNQAYDANHYLSNPNA